jgi:hypothetical protein
MIATLLGQARARSCQRWSIDHLVIVLHASRVNSSTLPSFVTVRRVAGKKNFL